MLQFKFFKLFFSKNNSERYPERYPDSLLRKFARFPTRENKQASGTLCDVFRTRTRKIAQALDSFRARLAFVCYVPMNTRRKYHLMVFTSKKGYARTFASSHSMTNL